MKIIDARYEILDKIDEMEVLKKIERVARTCYKSEDYIKEGSGFHCRICSKRSRGCSLPCSHCFQYWWVAAGKADHQAHFDPDERWQSNHRYSPAGGTKCEDPGSEPQAAGGRERCRSKHDRY